MANRRSGFVFAVPLLVGALPAAAAQVPSMFTAAEESAGKAVYDRACGSCHGAELGGASGPALAGAAFATRWNGRPVRDLLEITTKQMPQNAPGSLSADDYRATIAYVLGRNGFAAAALDTPIAARAADGKSAPKYADVGTAPFPRPPQSVRPANGATPTDAALAALRPGDWAMYNRDYRGQRYSPLTQINTANVGKLTPVCILQLGEVGPFEPGPVIDQGRMYVTTARNTFALDATTCRLIWKNEYKPVGPEQLPTNRGVAIYKGKLFRGTPDGHLLAIDAADGSTLWDAHVANSANGYYLSAVPVVADDKVIMGEAGADQGADGHIHAFDAATGKALWTFDLIPTGDQPGAETWKAGAEHGGGSMWTTITYDPARKLLYAPVGNPAPDYDGAKRPGDNLYTNSVIVLDPATGKLAWYAQQTPHDTHDWDTGAAPVVYDRGAASYMAVATKGGWLYLYDRASHKLLSKSEVTTHENDGAEASDTPAHVCPGQIGGIEWNGPAYDPGLGSLFVGSVDWCGLIQKEEGRYIAGSMYMSGRFTADPVEKAGGWLRSFDAVTGKERWRYRSATPMIAAVTPTAGGLVFTGDNAGDFLAFDARTGKILYRFNTGGAVGGGIATYEQAGRQYVAVASGNASRGQWKTTGAATVVVFALPK